MGCTMTLTQLRYFVSIARHKSLSRAAGELNVSQPALSRQIKLLESELECELLERHPSGVSLTDSGQILSERASRQLRELDQIRVDVSDASFAPTGRLRIGCPPSLLPRLLLRPLDQFMKLHPKVIVEVQESVSDQLSRAVLLDRLDIALVSSTAPEASSHFLTEALFNEPVWLFGPKNRLDALPGDKLHELPLILTHSNNAARDLAERKAMKSGRHLNVVAETDSTRLMLEMMKAGLGYTIAPYLTFFEQLGRRELVGAPVGRLAVQRFIITRKDRSANKAIQLFKSLLRPEISEAMKEIARGRTHAAREGVV
jgi:LysR family transcriptional regulator, nitrogen assimilation regulatory protein